jgi:hypothetical protein
MGGVIINPHTGGLATKKEIRITNPGLAKFAAFADDAFRQLHLTVVCLTCGQTPQMANASTDAKWRMECSCTVRVLRNPGVH